MTPTKAAPRGSYEPRPLGETSPVDRYFDRSEPAGIGYASPCPVSAASARLVARSAGEAGRIDAFASDVDGRGHE